MSSRHSDDLVSHLNSLGFYSEDCIQYTNGDLTVERDGSDLIGTTIDQLAEQVAAKSTERQAG